MPDQPENLDFGVEMTWNPVRIAQPGAWTGHLPFAFWLVKALRPASFVELGTHSGNSYFAFCQAIDVFCPGARAYAVDTWQGDEHAGHYGEDVYDDVARFNAAHFSQFSTLIRDTFDGARGYFPDGGPEGGIDLLHVDGLHSYEAVSHDFDTWRSTLSPRGVVLFHDINVRERGFGVWRLWEELRTRYLSFTFGHSNGLGVLGVGPDQASALRDLYALDPVGAAAFRRRIAARGEVFERQADILALREQLVMKDHHILNLTEQINGMTTLVAGKGECQADILALREQLVAKDHHILSLTEQIDGFTALVPGKADFEAAEAREYAWGEDLLKAQREQLAAKNAMIATIGDVAAARAAALVVRDRIINVRDELAMRLSSELREQRQGYEQLLADLRTKQMQTQNELNRAHKEAHEAVEAITRQYVSSTSWRLTRPLRVGVRLLRERRLRPAALTAAVHPPPKLPPVTSVPPPRPTPEDNAMAAKAAMRATHSARLDAFLTTTATLRLPRAERPDLSIILVLHNQAELTFGCLGSIAETLAGADLAVEVVILDNGSTDRTNALLDRIDGATIIRSDSNLHFLRGANQAARSAKGRTLLLLNNDAQLLPGAVIAGLHTLNSASNIGAVGGRIILPDGTLQEAGSIVWRNGATCGYGRGQDPNTPDFMFQRDVDYCSGAYLLTPMAVWKEMGGFDESYAPAYYEETDYCLRLWKSGRRVVFDPDVAIIHYEFGSSASASEALALQEVNRRIFVQRHRDWLNGQFPPDPLNVFAARTARSERPRVLVIDDRVPKLELGTGYPRANRLLHELVAGDAEVALFPVHRHAETWNGVRRALDKRIEVLIAADGTQLRSYLEARRGHFDAIIVCRPPNMEIFEKTIGYEIDLIGNATVIYDAEALFVTRDLQRRAAMGDTPSDLERHSMVAAEVALARLADSVLSVSPAEQQTLETYGAKDVRILAHALEDEPLETGFEERDRIVFLGAIQSDDAPNADALRWFTDEVLPGVRHSLGRETRVAVIGLNEAPSIEALDGTTLDLRGMVVDLRAALADARVMVVPSRLGAGIPHKAHQAAVLGIPMVVTRLIAEQLGWRDGQEVLIADDATAFAAACASLYTDRDLWEGIRRKALERVKRECAPDAFASRVRMLLETVRITHRRPDRGDGGECSAAPSSIGKENEPTTSRPEGSDYSLEVPFDFLPMIAPTPRVAVICHLFYPEIGSEMRAYLQNLPVPANLLFSTDTSEKAASIRATFADWEHGRLEVRVTPNRGRDIAPKLISFADDHKDHDLVLHLHSKRSDHAPFLAPWRGFLYENLLGSRAAVSSILDAFARLPQLGMVAPQHFEPIRRWIGWNGNFDAAKDIAGRMGIKLSPVRALDFPSGSMFWARPAALKPLLDLNLSFDDFPTERGQPDHTPAHAIERLFFLVCERSGHVWLKVAQPALYANTDAIVTVRSPAELERFLHEQAVALTGPVLLPVSNEPAPLVTRVPPGLARRLAQRKF
jgi:O-antigen biosynthesis protein